MTRDGAVAENLTTGETTSISERPQEENYSQAPTAAAEKAVDRIGAEVEGLPHLDVPWRLGRMGD